MVRYGELALKRGGTRTRFEKALVSNIRTVLSSGSGSAPGEEKRFKIRKERGRIFIDSAEPEEHLKKLTKIFGIVSVSLAEKIEFAGKEDIVNKGKQFAEGIGKGETFAIRARRAGEHVFSSQDVARELGALIVETRGAKVDLENPEHEILVEIREKEAYFYKEKLQGCGGLPFGIEGKAVCLISGGIDSPVASWLMMKRGCRPVFVHASLYPFGDERGQLKAVESVRILRGYMPSPATLYIIPHGELLEEAMKAAPHKLICLICRRAMLRYANEIARREGALAIVTGESLGQVASQTLQNLNVEDCVSKLPVFRPLIGLDKVEIERFAKKIGTFDASIKPAMCCTAVPEHPEVGADRSSIEDEESFMEIEKLVEKALAGVQKVVV